MFERLSISDEVVFATNSLINQLKRELKQSLRDVVDKDEYSGTFLFRAFGTTFKVEYTAHFKNVGFENQIQSIDLENRIIRLSFVCNDGIFDNETFYDGIAHELTHAYQKSMKQKGMSDNFYDSVSNVALNIENKYSDNLSMLAKGLYFAKNVEQDAYIHGMYNQVLSKFSGMDNFSVNQIRRTVLSTRFAMIPYMLLKIKEIALTDRTAFDQMIELGLFKKKGKRKHNTQYLVKLYIQTIDKARKRIQKKINNVINKLEYDFFGEHE